MLGHMMALLFAINLVWEKLLPSHQGCLITITCMTAEYLFITA